MRVSASELPEALRGTAQDSKPHSRIADLYPATCNAIESVPWTLNFRMYQGCKSIAEPLFLTLQVLPSKHRNHAPHRTEITHKPSKTRDRRLPVRVLRRVARRACG